MHMLMNVVVLVLFINKSSLSSDEFFQIDLGKDVTFSCLFPHEYQLNQVSFLHQTSGDVLSLGLELFIENSRMKLIPIGLNRLDFKIESVGENDSGLYTCFINDDELSSFSLQVLIPPEFIWYSPKEARVSYPEGSSLNFSCRAFAIPSVNITWIYRDEKKQSKIIHVGEDIYLSSLKWSSSGLYECVASNGYHSTINRSFYVSIQYAPRLIQHEFLHRDRTTIEFVCEFCSNPLSIIQWRKSNEILHNNEHFYLETDLKSTDEQHCLTTKLLVRGFDKSGRYQCQANNSLGYYSHHFDYYPNIVAKSRTENHSFLTRLNETVLFSNSSKCSLHMFCIVQILLIFVEY